MGAEQSTSIPTVKDASPSALPKRPPSALVVCGPSGVGKGTLIELLLEESDGFGFSVSHTTRQPRSNEKNGVEYYFAEKAEFEKGIEQNMFLEYAKVHENYYGTSKAEVDKILNLGTCCILDIDVQGARQVRKSGLRAVFVFIAPPSIEELENRLRGRKTENEDQIFVRLKNARSEMQSMNEPGLFDFCIINGDLSSAYADFRMIAMKAKDGVLPDWEQNGNLSPTRTNEVKERSPFFESMRDWKEKFALVHQAGSPAGTEICIALCKVGMRILAVGHNREDLEKLQANIVSNGCGPSAQNLLPVVCDTTKEGEVVSLRRIAQNRWPEASSVDVLINIASFVKEQTEWLNGSSSSWSDMLNRNLLGCLVCCREVMKAMNERKREGMVINVAVMDINAPNDGRSFFKAISKALQSLSQDLMQKVAGTNIRVIQIASDHPQSASKVSENVLSVLACEMDSCQINL